MAIETHDGSTARCNPAHATVRRVNVSVHIQHADDCCAPIERQYLLTHRCGHNHPSIATNLISHLKPMGATTKPHFGNSNATKLSITVSGCVVRDGPAGRRRQARKAK